MGSLRRPVRHISRVVFALSALLIATCTSAAANPTDPSWRIGPPASWVREATLPSAATPSRADTRSGKVYVLVDQQVRIGAPTAEYHRQAWSPLSSAAVQDAPEIEIDFDPSYERLVIHHVRLLRHGRDVFHFTPADVRVIQQETDLDQQIYSGELTAVVFLRDLRPGDVVDYAYSREGSNPILGAGFDDVFWLAYASPVQHLRYVVHAPSEVGLHIAPRNTGAAPTIEDTPGWRTFTWEARDTPETLEDDDEPDWYDPDPRIEVTTFPSWGAVAQWATSLFETQLKPSAEVARLANQWRAMPGGVTAAATAAVRFVQDDVRYLGIEIGPSSHEPHAPGQVLRQRFGDCKDKALLLVALLRELGVDAAPALVNTTSRHELDNAQPSPFAFDHAIVTANLAGRTLWIDATETGKGGAIEDWDPPEFERALVLRPGVAELARIPLVSPAEPRILVREMYTLGAAGAPTRLQVTTTYHGADADDMRHTLATTSPAELAKRYLDSFARENVDIRPLKRPTTRDDRDANLVTVTESYELATFWKRGERELYAWQIREYLPSRAASTRTTPLAVPHPVHVRHEIVVRASAPFRIDARKQAIADAAFAFSWEVGVAGDELRLAFDYRSLADSVPPAKLRAHQEAADRVRDAITFVVDEDLREPGARPGPLATWLPVGLAAVLLAGGLLALRRRRRSEGERPALPY
ncbi:MAG: DUF3857 domain-containing protein [Bacteroidales bacterium]